MGQVIGILILGSIVLISQVVLSGKIKDNYTNEEEQEKRINMLIAAQFLVWFGVLCVGAFGFSIIKQRPKIYLFIGGLFSFIIGCMLFHSSYTDDLF